MIREGGRDVESDASVFSSPPAMPPTASSSLSQVQGERTARYGGGMTPCVCTYVFILNAP